MVPGLYLNNGTDKTAWAFLTSFVRFTIPKKATTILVFMLVKVEQNISKVAWSGTVSFSPASPRKIVKYYHFPGAIFPRSC